MRITTLTAFLFLFTTTLAHADDPVALERNTLTPVGGQLAPSSVTQLPAVASGTMQKNGTMEIQAGTVQAKKDGNATIFSLSNKPRIKHSSQVNGSFTLSANRIQFSVPADIVKNPDFTSLPNLDATGSCSFRCDSIHISAESISLKATAETVRSTLTFDGDVLITTNGLTASASSVTLSRSGTTWTLSGLLAVPKDGG